MDSLDEGTVMMHKLKHPTAFDSTLARAKHYVLHGWPRRSEGLEPRMVAFSNCLLELSLAHELGCWGPLSCTYMCTEMITGAPALKLPRVIANEVHSAIIVLVARLDWDIEGLVAKCQNRIDNLPMPPVTPLASGPRTRQNHAFTWTLLNQ